MEFIIISIIFFIIGIILLSYNIENIYIGFIIIVSFALSNGFLISYFNEIPKAIDVYKGNTTLEITYKDSIPIDSVVVFK